MHGPHYEDQWRRPGSAHQSPAYLEIVWVLPRPSRARGRYEYGIQNKGGVRAKKLEQVLPRPLVSQSEWDKLGRILSDFLVRASVWVGKGVHLPWWG